MPTISKKELVDRIADKTNVKHTDVKIIVQQFLYEITTELSKNSRIEFRDFGVFEIKERAARKAQNPKTLEPINVPAKKIVRFKEGRLMKEKVNSNQ